MQQGQDGRGKNVKIDVFKALSEFMDHPIKIQLFFYLTTLGELSLSELTRLLDKSKTTIHHHTRNLEKEGRLVTREQVTKNYKEKYYKVHPAVESLLSSGNALEKAVKQGELTSRHLSYLFKAFSALTYSVTQRYSQYLLENPEIKATDLPVSAINATVTDYKEYQKAIAQITKILGNLGTKKTSLSPFKDSYAIFTIFVPYGKIFANLDEKDENHTANMR